MLFLQLYPWSVGNCLRPVETICQICV